MLNFDADRFISIQSGAVALAGAIDGMVASFLSGGGANVFFLGTGGAAILMQPAVQLLQARSTLPVFNPFAAELVLTGAPHLGPRSLVVIPSLSGTTKESIAALDYAKARGARIAALVGHAGTPLAAAADDVFVNFAADDTSSESFYIQSLLLALSILHHRREMVGYADRLRELQQLPAALLALKQGFEDEAARIADRISRQPLHIFSGAGSSWPQAFYYAMCILEEMQWIRTRPVHASDFFHGTLELVEKGVSIVLLKGEDALRPLVDRVEAFARAYTDELVVLDAQGFALPGVSTDLRGLISPIVLATALERVSAHLEVIRSHPLTTRRYYKRVAY